MDLADMGTDALRHKLVFIVAFGSLEDGKGPPWSRPEWQGVKCWPEGLVRKRAGSESSRATRLTACESNAARVSSATGVVFHTTTWTAGVAHPVAFGCLERRQVHQWSDECDRVHRGGMESMQVQFASAASWGLGQLAWPRDQRS